MGFFWLDNSVMDDYGAQIGPYGIAIYCALARRANEAGQCWPSRAALARVTGMSVRTVDAALGKLQQAGLVQVTRRMDAHGDPTSSLYTLTTPEAPSCSLGIVQMGIPSCAGDAPPPVQEMHHSHVGDAPGSAGDAPPPAPDTPPLADWPDWGRVRERLGNVIPHYDIAYLRGVRGYLDGQRGVLAFPSDFEASQMERYRLQIANVAQRVTKVARPIEYVTVGRLPQVGG